MPRTVVVPSDRKEKNVGARACAYHNRAGAAPMNKLSALIRQNLRTVNQ